MHALELAPGGSRPGADTPPRVSHPARLPPVLSGPQPTGVVPPLPGECTLRPPRAGRDSAAAPASAPWPRWSPGPDASAPGQPRPGPAWPVPNPVAMCYTLHRAKHLVRSPGSGGLRPAPGPPGLPGDGDAGRPPRIGLLPDYRDGRDPGPAPGPPG